MDFGLQRKILGGAQALEVEREPTLAAQNARELPHQDGF